MSSTLTTTQVARAIRVAFHRADPCHCETTGKLGEDELLRYLIGQEVLSFADVGPMSVPIEALSPHGSVWELSQHVETLNQLTDWTYADLVALPSIGPSAATKIEQALATFGLSLKDGAAPTAKIAAPIEPTPPPLSSASPDETRAACASALIKLGAMVARDGSALFRFASDAMAGKKMAGRIKRYGGALGQSRGAEVLRVAGPLIALEEAERPGHKPTSPRRARRQVEPEAAENVIRPAFAGRAS